ncbi:ryncolin-1-like isoform X2 [Patiria miniata]|uniref:Fibrinogen C-terminal domain-containing protein n=1 Tax=Patiria miniata TaxID=46514 RepID=A0A913ZVI5_PATMI|nr:ryncolin-1-like isoform X2 [Patiria miniata]
MQVDCSISSTEIQPSVLVDNAWIKRSCQDFAMEGHVVSGIYTIYPTALSHGLQVYCDMETDGGGWIVIQRRQDGSVDFYRDWADYQVGFGDLSGEFWIGNDILRNLTEKGTWQLRVDLEDWDNVAVYADYGQFQVLGDKYKLWVGSYIANSTAGDSLSSHNGKYFTTKDQDNDNGVYNCAEFSKGGWWYDNCYHSNLNGMYMYYQTQGDPASDGIVWSSWKEMLSLKKSSIKIKRLLV